MRLKPLIIIALAALLIAVPRGAVTAQSGGTPIVPSNGCTVEPMPQERIDELAAMAAASPDAGLPTQAISLPEGTPITSDVQAQLQDTLFQINACSWANDLPRLLSLYSERFIVAQFFAPETVPIVAAPDRTPESATPVSMPTDQQPMIFEAVQLPDGRIAALISPNSWGGDRQIVWFVQQDGRWLVDMTSPASDTESPGSGGSMIPADAQSVVELVLQDAATQLGVDPSALTVSAIEPTDWPDSSLGCPEEGGVYAQVISPGYQITVTDGSATLIYHTGPNDIFVPCAP
jgi:hypothetical protein